MAGEDYALTKTQVHGFENDNVATPSVSAVNLGSIKQLPQWQDASSELVGDSENTADRRSVRGYLFGDLLASVWIVGTSANRPERIARLGFRY
jgi:hypothetical protein